MAGLVVSSFDVRVLCIVDFQIAMFGLAERILSVVSRKRRGL